MINYADIYKELRTSIKSRFEVVDTDTGTVQSPLSVIQAMTTGVRPRGVYATLDIVDTGNSNSDLTNKWHEEDEGNVTTYYETHRDVQVMISIRNGDPEDFEAQMRVPTMCNNLHKAFEERLFLDDLYDRLKATVKSKTRVRPAQDKLPTGFGNVSHFVVVISMADITEEYAEDWFTNAEVEFKNEEG